MSTEKDEQSLDAFAKEMQGTLKRFQVYYKDKAANAANPEYWPLKMGSAEWYEQFLAFMDGPDAEA